MQSYEGSNERGLVYGFVLDGEGGARRIQRNELEVLDLRPQESLWLHWDRSVPQAQQSSSLPAEHCALWDSTTKVLKRRNG